MEKRWVHKKTWPYAGTGLSVQSEPQNQREERAQRGIGGVEKSVQLSNQQVIEKSTSETYTPSIQNNNIKDSAKPTKEFKE